MTVWAPTPFVVVGYRGLGCPSPTRRGSMISKQSIEAMSDRTSSFEPPTPEGHQSAKTRRVRSKPKGRSVDAEAMEEVRALLGQHSRRRDLLIEHLHRIQDRFNYLSARHLVALAAEMRLS